MKSLKLKLFEFNKGLNIDETELDVLLREHINLCENYSEKEIYGSLSNHLDKYKFYESVNTLLTDIDQELSSNPMLYNLKDLYAKVARKQNRFLYENALQLILGCINQPTNEDRAIRVLEDLKLYEWIPEIKLFLYENAITAQDKQNYSKLTNGGKVEDVYSVVLQIKEGYLTYISDKWFILSKEGITATLLENHIKDDVQLRKLRLIEEAIQKANFEENKITFKISEDLTVSFDTNKKMLYLNGAEAENTTTLETLFNSPIIPFVGKAFYPVLNETFNNLDKFMKIDTVKHVYNMIDSSFECYVFNYEGKISQYRIDKRLGNSYYTYESAMPLIENVIYELGADLTLFYENLISQELKDKMDLDKEEKVLLEKIEKLNNDILLLNDSKDLVKENKMLQTVYNSLLSKKHKLSENLKTVKVKKAKLMNKKD